MTQTQYDSFDRRFIADAAQQLRTPLAALQVQLELSLKERSTRRHGAAVYQAMRALTRLEHMLHQLLTLAHADEMNPEAFQPVDLDRVARDAVEERVELAIAQCVDLGYAPPRAPVYVRGQPDLLREAVVNLVDNALRYGGGGSRVYVGVIPERREIYVRDEGPGIPAAELVNVRDRFYRIRGTDGDGCGLGLSIADTVARGHGGWLVLESGPCGIGLHARIALPQ